VIRRRTTATAARLTPATAAFKQALADQDVVLAAARRVGADPRVAWAIAEKVGPARACELLRERGPGLPFEALALEVWAKRQAQEAATRQATAEELAGGRSGPAGEPPAPRRTLLSGFGR